MVCDTESPPCLVRATPVAFMHPAAPVLLHVEDHLQSVVREVLQEQLHKQLHAHFKQHVEEHLQPYVDKILSQQQMQFEELREGNRCVMDAQSSLGKSHRPTSNQDEASRSQKEDCSADRPSWYTDGFDLISNKLESFAVSCVHDIPKSVFLWVVHSAAFQLTTTLVIIANAVFIGFEMERQMQCHKQNIDDYRAEPDRTHEMCNSNEGVVVASYVFIVFFTLELMLRILAERRYFFFGSERVWNFLDMALVALGLLDVFTENRTYTYLRIARVLRTVHVLRVIRLISIFGVLRKLVNSMLQCSFALFWLLILLIFVLYLFSLGLMQAILVNIESNGSAVHLLQGKSATHTGSLAADLFSSYGSIMRSMSTLFKSMTGGLDWGEAMAPIAGISQVGGVVFFIFILFTVFAIMNVVTGVFVDQALAASDSNRDSEIDDRITQQRKEGKMVSGFFKHKFEASSGKASKADLQDYLRQNKRARVFLSTVGLQLQDDTLDRFMEIVEWDEKGEIDTDHFVQCCLRVKGPASSIDFLHLSMRVGNIYTICAELKKHHLCCHQFDRADVPKKLPDMLLFPGPEQTPHRPVVQTTGQSGVPFASNGS